MSRMSVIVLVLSSAAVAWCVGADPDGRFVGGSATTIERYPYAVQVLRDNQVVCGGTLLSQRHVLTAAHCFYVNGNIQNARVFTIRTGNSTLDGGKFHHFTIRTGNSTLDGGRNRRGTGGGGGSSGGGSSGGSGGSGSGSGNGSGNGSGSGSGGNGSGSGSGNGSGSSNNNNNNSQSNQNGNPIQAVSLIIVHEQYERSRPDNNVAVALMSAAVTLGLQAAAARLPLQGYVVPDNVTAVHVGWGVNSANTSATQLREVSTVTVSLEECLQRYAELQNATGQPYSITENMICAAVSGTSVAGCQGDSGGPLIYNGVVVGVTSWGYGCAEPMFPGVSARTASYSNWISQTMARYNTGNNLASPALGTIVLLTLISSIVITV